MLTSLRNFFQRLYHPPAGRLPVSTYVGYGAGQIGGQILRDTPALILPIYMTTVLGIEAALAGLVIIIAKIWVVIADPIAGVVSLVMMSEPGVLIVGAIGAVVSTVQV